MNKNDVVVALRDIYPLLLDRLENLVMCNDETQLDQRRSESEKIGRVIELYEKLAYGNEIFDDVRKRCTR